MFYLLKGSLHRLKLPEGFGRGGEFIEMYQHVQNQQVPESDLGKGTMIVGVGLKISQRKQGMEGGYVGFVGIGSFTIFEQNRITLVYEFLSISKAAKDAETKQKKAYTVFHYCFKERSVRVYKPGKGTFSCFSRELISAYSFFRDFPASGPHKTRHSKELRKTPGQQWS
jgi:hypothetical protein